VQHLHSADKSSTFTQRIARLNISLIGLVPEITSDGLCAQRLVQRSYYEHNYPGDYRSEHDRESRQDPEDYEIKMYCISRNILVEMFP
jgi:hypothetical protein